MPLWISFGKLAYDFLLHLVTLFHAFSAGKGHLAGVGAAGSGSLQHQTWWKASPEQVRSKIR